MVDALNYLGESGWEFGQAYVIMMGQRNVDHWLLKKNAWNKNAIVNKN